MLEVYVADGLVPFGRLGGVGVGGGYLQRLSRVFEREVRRRDFGHIVESAEDFEIVLRRCAVLVVALQLAVEAVE